MASRLFYKMRLSSCVFISCLCVYVSGLDLELVADYNITDCLQKNNDNKDKYFGVDSYGFPFCTGYSKNITCDPEDDSCGPGLKCNEKSKKCEVDIESCFKYYANVEGNDEILKFLWAPDCLEDGSWAPKQCKGGVGGRCFCYSAKGERIFGQAFEESSNDMTCACSRRKAELSETNKKAYSTIHCDEKGNFEELQCDNGHCWCVEPKTGNLTSIIVPEKHMEYLKCYKELKGSEYLRKCESIAYAQAKIIEEMERHGTSANIEQLECQDDGSYGPTIIQKSLVYCVTNTNSKMSYYSEIKNDASRDCNCANDEQLYQQMGKTFNLVCNSDGSYTPLQTLSEGYSICVDKDGIQMIDRAASLKDSYCKILYNF